jgi:hypothetical protein
MFNRARLAIGLVLAGSALFTTAALAGVASVPVAGAAVRPNSGWMSCNDTAPSHAPGAVALRIKQVTTTHRTIPRSFWSNAGYRGDIEKIVCYESTYHYHAAAAGGQYGWFQMSRSLISSEGISWSQYWSGNRTRHAGWYQALAGERYILNRYGNPANAWAHERDYGWY